MNHLGNRKFEQNKIIDTLTNSKTPINTNTKIFAWAPHKQNILACAVQNEIQLWTEKKINEWTMAIIFKCHSNPVISLEWAPYETQLMFASIDNQGNCIIHNKSTENWDPTIKLQQKVNQIAFSPQFLKFATSSDIIQIWNNYKVLQEIQIKSDKIIFTSNLLIILENRSVYIYNSTSDKYRLRQHITEQDQINSIALSITGSKLGLIIGNITKFYSEDETNEFIAIN